MNSFKVRQFNPGIVMVLIIAGVLCLLCVGCNKKSKKHAYTIAFSQCVGSDLWRKTMLEEMQTELSLHGDVEFIYRDADGDSKKQIQQVAGLLKRDIDLLIISPNEAEPLTGIVDKVYSSGIPVIVIDRKTKSTSYSAYVGANNQQIGYMAGNYIGLTSNKPTKILEITGLSGSSPAIERARGFDEGISGFKHITVTQKINGEWLKEVAQQKLLQQPQLLNGVDAVFAHNDVMANGVYQVLNQLKLTGKIKVIGVDALPGTGGGLEMVDRQILTASMVYPTGGREAISTAFKILNREPFERENILQSVVIDASNVQLMKMQLSKINSQQGDIIKQRALLAEQAVLYKSQQSVLNIVIVTLILAIVCGGLAFYWLVEYRKVNVSLEHKTQEILKQRNQLIEMSAKAESAVEARFNFFTNVSHEFRTPLTLMISSMQDMLEHEKITAPLLKSAKIIQKNTFRLLKLVNELIDFRKIEVDKQTIKAGKHNIVAYLRDITESFQYYARKSNILLTLSANEKDIPLWFDVNLLDKVFFNLISNAVKFSSAGCKVNVSVSRGEANTVNIVIEDNGSGMTDEELAFIFDQYYQADNAPVAGSGIGLALARQIVELHHGQITVTSKKWSGTAFNVSLPLGAAHLSENEKQETEQAWPDLSARIQYYHQDNEPVAENNAAPVLNDQPKEHSVLIIEDDEELLSYLAEKLSLHYEVYTVNNGINAINEVYEKMPDLIISDVVLPGRSGKEIAATLKKDFRTSHIPIVLLTAQSSLEQQISGLNAMVDMYISKPFDFNYLLAGVKNLLQNRSILKEYFTSEVTSPEKLPLSKSLDRKFINDFKGIIELHLADEKFGVDEICKSIGVSRIQLYRKVKALLGCSVLDYLTSRRLKKAQYLLMHEDHSIAEVTYLVGFSSPAYFSTVFKSKYGVSPSEYKKAN